MSNYYDIDNKSLHKYNGKSARFKLTAVYHTIVIGMSKKIESDLIFIFSILTDLMLVIQLIKNEFIIREYAMMIPR